MEHVLAQWGNRQFPAVLNDYGVATIAAGVAPIAVEDVALERSRHGGGGPAVTARDLEVALPPETSR